MFSTFSFFEQKTELPNNSSRTFIRQSSPSRMFALRFTLIFRMLTTTLAIMNIHKEIASSDSYLWNNKIGLSIQDSLMFLLVVGDLIDLVHTFHEEKRSVQSVREELIKSGRFSSEVSSKFDPLLVISKRVPSPYKSVQWRIGEKALYNHISHMVDIFDYLKQYQILNMPKKPTQFNFFYNLVPFTRPNWDMPSKVRLTNCLIGIYGFKAGNYLTDYFNLVTPANFALPIGFAALTVLSTALESYHLNQVKLELNLEGFSYKYEQNYPKQGKPKTCIGTQITRQILLYTPNKNFIELLNYVAKGETRIRELLADNTLPKEVQHKLSHFKFFLEIPKPNNDLKEEFSGLAENNNSRGFTS